MTKGRDVVQGPAVASGTCAPRVNYFCIIRTTPLVVVLWAPLSESKVHFPEYEGRAVCHTRVTNGSVSILGSYFLFHEALRGSSPEMESLTK